MSLLRPSSFVNPLIYASRETNKAVRGKTELWAVVQANARHARDVADAVDARDLQEVKRIVDRAKLTRHEFLSVCDRLGFRTRNETDESEDGNSPSDEGEEAARPTTVLGDPPAAGVTPTSARAAPGGAKTSPEDQVIAVVDPASLLGKVPVFFLDAEGRGGTTALALATIENDAETVRRLIKEVSADCKFLIVTPGRDRIVNDPVSRSVDLMRWNMRRFFTMVEGGENIAVRFWVSHWDEHRQPAYVRQRQTKVFYSQSTF